MRSELRCKIFTPNPRMDMTFAEPDIQLAPRRALDMCTQEHVGDEEDQSIFWQARNYFYGVRARATDVGHGLHCCTGIHVGNDDSVRVLLATGPHVLRVDRLGERTAGLEIRQQNRFLGIQNRRGLDHEMHATENDDVGIRPRRFARQPERITDEVSDILHLWPLVAMCQDDRKTLLLESENLSNEFLLFHQLD